MKHDLVTRLRAFEAESGHMIEIRALAEAHRLIREAATALELAEVDRNCLRAALATVPKQDRSPEDV